MFSNVFDLTFSYTTFKVRLYIRYCNWIRSQRTLNVNYLGHRYLERINQVPINLYDSYPVHGKLFSNLSVLITTESRPSLSSYLQTWDMKSIKMKMHLITTRCWSLQFECLLSGSSINVSVFESYSKLEKTNTQV